MRPYQVKKIVEGKYRVSRECPLCNKTTSVKVLSQDLWDYEHAVGDKRFVQVAFPYVEAADREAVFVSGVCAECWDKMFADDENDSTTGEKES